MLLGTKKGASTQHDTIQRVEEKKVISDALKQSVGGRKYAWGVSKHLLDKFVYAIAIIALVSLTIFFRKELGLMIIPVFGIILLLIIFEIKEIHAHTERLILFVVIFMLFVAWGLFAVAEENRKMVWFQDHRLSPAIEELTRWSRSRNLIQATRSPLRFHAENESIIIDSPIEWRGISGPSMQPGIFPGNTVLLIPLENGTPLREGQIVRVSIENVSLIHRIIAVYDNEIIIQGDNSLKRETISREDITHLVGGSPLHIR